MHYVKAEYTKSGEKKCSRCHEQPVKADGQRYCKECHAENMRAYRKARVSIKLADLPASVRSEIAKRRAGGHT